MTKLDSILKNRGITLPVKVSLVKDMVFPIVMYGCESWTIKKAEHQIIDAFELCCWRRLLRVPWSARGSNQSILKEISPEYPLEGLMLKLETPILWPPDTKNWLIWKDPDAGKEWRWEEKGMTEDELAGWHHQLDGRESEWTPGVGDGQGGLVRFMGLQRVGHDWATELTGWLTQVPEDRWKCLRRCRGGQMRSEKGWGLDCQIWKMACESWVLWGWTSAG